jgi:hypothetical protein
LLTVLIVLLILLTGIAITLPIVALSTLLGASSVLLVLLAGVLILLTALLAAHLVALVLLCHFGILSCAESGTSVELVVAFARSEKSC